MLNGEGLRVVLWVSGCDHHCKGCHNEFTWDVNSGLDFDEAAKNEIYDALSKDYISGITISGGDPFHPDNIQDISNLALKIKTKYPSKSIWTYTGYLYEELLDAAKLLDIYGFTRRSGAPLLVGLTDVLVDGKFEIDKADRNLHWIGSGNQRVIDVPQSLNCGTVVLYQG